MTSNKTQKSTHSHPLYGEVTVTQSSPYGVPWQGPKEERPSDYFNSIQTDIEFKFEGKAMKASIAGKGRSEMIKLLIDGNEVHFPGDKNLFSFNASNETFDFDHMYYLEEIIAKSLEGTPNDKTRPTSKQSQMVTSYIERTVFDDRKTNTKVGLENVLDPYLKKARSSPGETRLLIPVIEQFDIKDPSKKHWYVCILTLNENKKPNLVIIESRDYISISTLASIKKYFSDALLQDLNSTLTKHGLPALSVDDVFYCQGKQYGQKGCGITASINIEKLTQSPELLAEMVFTEEDQHIDDSKENRIILPDSAKKKSSGGNMIAEALRRIELALELDKRQRMIDQYIKPKNHSEAALNIHEYAMKQIRRNPIFLTAKAANDAVYSSPNEHKQEYTKKKK